jgi:hypothetical protein
LSLLPGSQLLMHEFSPSRGFQCGALISSRKHRGLPRAGLGQGEEPAGWFGNAGSRLPSVQIKRVVSISWRRVGWWTAGFAVAALGPSPSAGAAPRPLQTAIVDPVAFTGPDAAAAFARAVATGARAIKIPLFWNGIAPATRPAHFDAADPSSPSYTWTALDAELRLARAHGLTPIVYIAGPPTWAAKKLGGAMRTDPAAYHAFALAAVRRYSGRVAGLPRVRYWEAWNEPNKVPDRSAKPGAAPWYRMIVNAFAASVHTVSGNEVVAGGLAPYGISTAVAPLAFMRSLLCVSPGASPHSTCSDPVHFDIWSTDPYTAGGPEHPVARSDDVSVAQLPRMKAVLDAGVRLGHVRSTGPVRFWVTEFSWDSDPPDPGGVPAALEGRWVDEALYRMWAAGVSLVTWFGLRDQPFRTSPYQSGLYYSGSTLAGDRPKPAFTAFRFPFVAFRHSGQIAVWGRTPTSAASDVVVEQNGPSGWHRVTTVRANSVGIFSAVLGATGRGALRAVMPATHATSLPFSLVSPPDRTYQPFGAPMPAATGKNSRSTSAVSEYVEVEPAADGSSVAGPSVQASLPARGGPAGQSALGAAAGAIGSAGARALALGGAILGATIWFGVVAIRARRAQLRRPGRR